MKSRKQPIRTYQRKTTKNPFMNSLAVRTVAQYNPVEDVRKPLDKNETFNNSLNYDPFETTFDRIAKEVVVPPLPPDINKDISWNGSSSDSDINNVTNIKLQYDKFKLSTFNNTSSSMHKSIKLTRKYKEPQKYEFNTLTKTLSKKTTKTETKSKTKAQGQKKQAHKMQKKKRITQSKSKESSSTCNQQSHLNSDVTSLKDVTCENDILHSNNIEHKKIFKTDKIQLQTTLNNFVTDLKYLSNLSQNIKPCFVKLKDCVIQNVVNTEKNVLHKCDTKLQTNEKISEIVLDTTSQSTRHNNVIGNFKNISLKSCSVILCDNIVGNCSEKCINSCLNAYDKSIVPNSNLHNSFSKITLRCNNNINLAVHGTKQSNENIIKNSFVRLEKLKVEEFVIKDNVTSDEKEQHMIVCSTPIGKCVRPTCSVLLSPIDTKSTPQNLKQNCLMMTDESISDIAQSHKYSNKKICLSIAPEDCKFDAADIQEQQTQVLFSSQNMQIIEDFAAETETSSKKNIHAAHVQQYSVKQDKMTLSHLFADTDQSQSLFSNTTHSYNQFMQDTTKNEIEKINEMISHTTLPNADSIMHIRQDQSDKAQENIVITPLENFKNETISNNKDSLFCHNQNDINILNVDSLHIQLQDSSRITARKRYPKQQHFNMPNISENSNYKNMQSNDNHVAYDKDYFHQQSGMNNPESSKNTSLNVPSYQFESFNSIQQHNDSTNRQIQKSIFLKPGKSWTRSLSILNNINDGCNLDKLSIGKGKKWRNSVRNLLDMQKTGIVQSYRKQDDTDLLYARSYISVIDISSDISKHKTFNSPNHIRFSKRISIRVVPNDTSAKHNMKDTPFLEVFGISTENSLNSKLSDQTQLVTCDNLIGKCEITAKDVVLKKCSQQSYLFFSECFPDSYLEHCRKIGEGVYGEVFLCNYNNRKSVIKIIPIEGKELVNGEPQKQFNEILSEIVIAKELDNLRLKNLHKTEGFVEVKNIKCIIGKYPEKLIKLWNIYDEEKTSDNDCPSMFSENQLYIALELGHGGEDLEAFVFQTAREACTSFLQIAFALAVAEKTLEFEHRDLHWGNILISRTENKYIYYNLDGKEIRLASNGVKVSIIDFTLSRMLYEECCIYNDLALDPALFTAHGEYQFEIYRLMRDKIQNNWQKFEPYTNILWLHYILDKMITMNLFLKLIFASLIRKVIATMHSIIGPKPNTLVDIIPMEEMFAAYCNMDPISRQKGVLHIPLSQSNKWLISARILDMVKLTTTNTGLTFFKFRKRALSYDEYLIYLKDLAKSYDLDFEDMKYRMQTSGKPLIHNAKKT